MLSKQPPYLAWSIDLNLDKVVFGCLRVLVANITFLEF